MGTMGRGGGGADAPPLRRGGARVTAARARAAGGLCRRRIFRCSVSQREQVSVPFTDLGFGSVEG